MMFIDRAHAGKQLADKLEQYLSSLPTFDRSNLLVVGLPRGGVPVALEVARKFACPLEVIVAKKLPFPGQPEYAIGAVTSDGVTILNSDIPKTSEWADYIDEQRRSLLDSTTNAERQFYDLAGYKQSSFKGKTVILVDDGIATGMTARAAAEAAKQRGAARTIIAAPVMSSDSLYELRSHCDAVVAVSVPSHFRAVGQHYHDFDQTSNQEVVRALREGVKNTGASGSSPQRPEVKPFGIINRKF